MATISASPRVAPLRWSAVPVPGARRESPHVVPPQVTPAPSEAAALVDWRIVGYIVAVFLGALVLSGILTRLGSTPPPIPSAAVAGPAESAAHPAYTVLAGDTLWDIARRSAPTSDPRTTVGEIRDLNGLSNAHVLQAGEVLLLPASR
jgi:LysM repeat protein